MSTEETMKTMAGRKRHSAADIVRKLRCADELAVEGRTGDEIAAERPDLVIERLARPRHFGQRLGGKVAHADQP
jgi:hypothetical protein